MLLRKASRIAGRLNRDWYCVYVQTPAESAARIDAAVQRKLVENIQRAQGMGAEVVKLESADVADKAIRAFAREERRHPDHCRPITAELVAAPVARLDCGASSLAIRRGSTCWWCCRSTPRRMKDEESPSASTWPVVPAILGVFTVAGLAYWGAYHRAAPEWVVVVAAVSAIGSLFLAWQNTRYVAQRIERLAGARAQRPPAIRSPLGVVRNAALPMRGGASDELDSIEEVVDHLTSAVSVAQADREARERVAAERVQEYAVLIDEGSAAVRRQLDEARVALHILLEHHFGPLNDNQDEMLEAARSGTEAAETELARLQEIAQLDRGALNVRREPLKIADLLAEPATATRGRCGADRCDAHGRHHAGLTANHRRSGALAASARAPVASPGASHHTRRCDCDRDAAGRRRTARDGAARPTTGARCGRGARPAHHPGPRRVDRRHGRRHQHRLACGRGTMTGRRHARPAVRSRLARRVPRRDSAAT